MRTAPTEVMDSRTEWYRIDNRRGSKLAYIRRLCEQIAAAFHPERIILFGSQADGEPTSDSDIDLLVVMPYEGSHARQAIRILGTDAIIVGKVLLPSLGYVV